MANATEPDPWSPPQSGQTDPPAPPGNSWARTAVVIVLMVGLYQLFGLLFRSVPASSQWVFLPALPVGLSLILLIGGPILVHRSQWIALDPGYQPFDPAGVDVPAEVVRLFDEAGRELERLGFACVLLRRTVGANPNSTGYVGLYRHGVTLEQVKLIGALGQSGVVRNVAALLACTTEFADGTEVVTSNRTTPTIFPKYPPPYHGAAFPEMTDAARLLEVHRGHVAEHSGGRIRVDPIGADPEASLRQKDHQRGLDHYVAVGYTWVDLAANRQRLTWKGAILSTWKLLWPIKQIRLAWDRRQARRHLARLEGR